MVVHNKSIHDYGENQRICDSSLLARCIVRNVFAFPWKWKSYMALDSAFSSKTLFILMNTDDMLVFWTISTFCEAGEPDPSDDNGSASAPTVLRYLAAALVSPGLVLFLSLLLLKSRAEDQKQFFPQYTRLSSKMGSFSMLAARPQL
mmetsp:Transcript_16848/g.29507  ORF Transcript_16848/g.29507 Transcript_16848/m.29507 type:complete len:147 (+) Transcript_16848:257-697(+)